MADNEENNDSTDNDDTGSGESSSSDTSGESGKTYTDADLQRIATKESKSGKAAAKREIAERFGVSIDDAAKIIEKHKADEEKAKDDVQRAKDEKAEADSRAAQAESRAAAMELRTALVESLVSDTGEDGSLSPLNLENKKAAMILAEHAAASSDEEDLDARVAEAVAYVRSEAPQFFGTANGDDGGRKSGTPQIPKKPAVQGTPGKSDPMQDGMDAYKRIKDNKRGPLLPSDS